MKSHRPYSRIPVSATVAFLTITVAATTAWAAPDIGTAVKDTFRVCYETFAGTGKITPAEESPFFVRDNMKTNPEAVKAYLAKRYGVNPDEIQFTPNDNYPIIVRNRDRASLRPKFDPKSVIKEEEKYDAVVIGCGPAGLTASVYMTDAGLKVLCLERQPVLGGLAMGSELNGIRAGGGAAYSVGAEGSKRYNIFKHMGLKGFKHDNAIREPIDSLILGNKYVKGIWEEKSLKKLPASFALFKRALEHASKEGMLARDTAAGHELDKIDFATFIQKMPEMVSQLKDPESQAIYKRFLEDKRIQPNLQKNWAEKLKSYLNPSTGYRKYLDEKFRADPMADVLGLMELYGRSALGKGPQYVSARQFGNFYESELFTRYTGQLGTGTIAEMMVKKLETGKRDFKFHTNASVAQIDDQGDKTLITYVREDGQTYQVESKKVIFASSLKESSDLIKGFEKAAPDRAQILSNLEMTDYNVQVMRVKGHPERGGYDLWVLPDDYTEAQPTDIINSRWMDPKINGYKGMRSFKKDPKDDFGVYAVYHSLGKASPEHDNKVLEIAENAARFFKRTLKPLMGGIFKGQEPDLELIESFRYPESIHVVEPGWLEKAEALAAPLGNIHFGNNTLGGPEVEYAIEKGFDAAQDVIKQLTGHDIHPFKAPHTTHEPIAEPAGN